jgi:hypothetical protein
MSLLFYPGSQLILKRRQAQKEMLRGLKTRRSRTKVTAKIFEFSWIQRLTALITFITSCFSEATVRTSAFQIAVRKESLAPRAISLEHLVSVNVAPLEQGEEYIMRNLSVILCAGSRKQVERDAQSLPAINELLMVFGHHFLRGGSLLFSTNCNRCSVLVTTGDHQYLIALKTMITGKNIGWQISTSDVS